MSCGTNGLVIDRVRVLAHVVVVPLIAWQPGLAVLADGDFTGLPARYVLIFNPTTGRLTASEQWLTTSAGKLGITVPASISYPHWLSRPPLRGH